ncbi:MAG: hypothetical protein KGO92_04220 [Bacteroidota bacterium]|nr:hypothetical protein [Bacteroidota bacterium]
MPYDIQQFKKRTWLNPLALHAILNPGVVYKELVLGQRFPLVMLIDRDKSKPIAERSFVPCPHCHTVHSVMKWSHRNKTALQNWFGLYCDHCGKIIPCLWNLTSMAILFITYPFWIFFKDSWEKKWLLKQQQRFSGKQELHPPETNSLLLGIEAGGLLLVFALGYDYLFTQTRFGWGDWFWILALCLLVGWLFGLFLKFVYYPKKKE